MSSLREVKDRIGSVRSTLKITSAMKLVASSKLLKAQRAIEGLRPYSEALNAMLAAAAGSTAQVVRPQFQEAPPASVTSTAADKPLLVLAFSSNSSMCGAFNANAIKKALGVVKEMAAPVEAWAFGRKMAEAFRKSGKPAARDYSALVGKPDYEQVAAIADELRGMYEEGSIAGVVLVYNHFVSTGKQVIVAEPYLGGGMSGEEACETYVPGQGASEAGGDDFILEPTRGELLDGLRPLVLNLRLYAALLDSVASEHAARMIAMQTATDNAEELLAELTLEYNKGRQQKITSEILDLVAGESVRA